MSLPPHLFVTPSPAPDDEAQILMNELGANEEALRIMSSFWETVRDNTDEPGVIERAKRQLKWDLATILKTITKTQRLYTLSAETIDRSNQLEAALETRNQDYDRVFNEKKQADAEIKDLQAQLKQARAEEATAKARLTGANTERDTLKDRLGETREERDAARNELDETRGERDTARNELKVAHQAAVPGVLHEHLSQLLQSQEERLNDRLETSVARLEGKIDSLVRGPGATSEAHTAIDPMEGVIPSIEKSPEFAISPEQLRSEEEKIRKGLAERQASDRNTSSRSRSPAPIKSRREDRKGSSGVTDWLRKITPHRHKPPFPETDTRGYGIESTSSPLSAVLAGGRSYLDRVTSPSGYRAPETSQGPEASQALEASQAPETSHTPGASRTEDTSHDAATGPAPTTTAILPNINVGSEEDTHAPAPVRKTRSAADLLGAVGTAVIRRKGSKVISKTKSQAKLRNDEAPVPQTVDGILNVMVLADRSGNLHPLSLLTEEATTALRAHINTVFRIWEKQHFDAFFLRECTKAQCLLQRRKKEPTQTSRSQFACTDCLSRKTFCIKKAPPEQDKTYLYFLSPLEFPQQGTAFGDLSNWRDSR